MTVTPDPALLALAEELRQAVGNFVRAVRGASGTPRDVGSETLDDLDRHGPMTVAALARLRQVRHQSMRVLAARLEADGLVTRTPDAQDARGHIVTISPAGRATLAQSRTARTSWIATSLQTQTTAREQQALKTAIAVLDRMTETSKPGPRARPGKPLSTAP